MDSFISRLRFPIGAAKASEAVSTRSTFRSLAGGSWWWFVRNLTFTFTFYFLPFTFTFTFTFTFYFLLLLLTFNF